MIYATLNADGEAVQIRDGEPFTTWFYRVTTEEEAAMGLCLVGDVIARELAHGGPVSLLQPEDLDRFQIVAIEPADAPPPGQRIVGHDLSVEDGAIVATGRLADLEDLRAAKRAEAVAAYEAQRQSEFTWDFGAIATKDDFGADLGPAGLQTLQMREEQGGDDQKNWSIAMTAALAFEGAGQAAAPLAMKTTANVWVQTTASQVLDVLLRGDGTQMAAVQRGMAQLQKVGALKAAIAAAADAEALAAIDVTAGWPGNT